MHTLVLVAYVFNSNEVCKLDAEASHHVEADSLVVSAPKKVVVVGRFRGGWHRSGGWLGSGARHH